jgi:high-affinity iron transporter
VIPSFLLSLREGLEAALIIGIVLGALRKMQRTDLNPIAWSGAIIAGGLSIGVAFVLHTLGASLESPAEQIFEGTTLFLAAAVLTWMIFWMHRQARQIKGNLEADVRKATLQSGKKAIFLLAFIAVLREGIELALFLTAAAVTTGSHLTLLGSIFGLGSAALLGWALFASTLRLDLQRFFIITGVLLILFSAGMVASGVHEFQEISWVPAIIEHVWDVNFLLNENSLVGEILKTLFGYNGSPSLVEVLSYLAYFVAIGIGLRLRSDNLPATQKA